MEVADVDARVAAAVLAQQAAGGELGSGVGVVRRQALPSLGQAGVDGDGAVGAGGGGQEVDGSFKVCDQGADGCEAGEVGGVVFAGDLAGAGGSRPTTITSCPRWCSRLAAAAPMPELAPVMTIRR
ncbi:hypothetical protein [Nonomuraea typhae]|uniref:hypothetical protein n=1 Tax=Nonomuraea typhae TaxID=2603600 RepID=UPI001FE3EAB6|nr:hypothetical protein [Nonomuraea typhae]